MADSHAHEQTHPYHLVDPSPWPLIGALSGFVMASGALLVMHQNSYWLLIIGTVMVMGTMFGWWRDVTDEAQNQGHHNRVVQVGLRYGRGDHVQRLRPAAAEHIDPAAVGLHGDLGAPRPVAWQPP